MSRIETEVSKLKASLRGKSVDPVTHEVAQRRETARQGIPDSLRKSAGVLNEEHEAKKDLAYEVVRQMFDNVAWDFLKNALRERGFVILPEETDKERTARAGKIEIAAKLHDSRTIQYADRAQALVKAAQVLLEDYDSSPCDESLLDALHSLLVAISSRLTKIKFDKREGADG